MVQSFVYEAVHYNVSRRIMHLLPPVPQQQYQRTLTGIARDICCLSVASCAATAVTYPLRVVVVRMIAQVVSGHGYTSVTQAVKTIAAEEGVHGFFKCVRTGCMFFGGRIPLSFAVLSSRGLSVSMLLEVARAATIVVIGHAVAVYITPMLTVCLLSFFRVCAHTRKQNPPQGHDEHNSAPGELADAFLSQGIAKVSTILLPPIASLNLGLVACRCSANSCTIRLKSRVPS
jgi:hypothetical protein